MRLCRSRKGMDDARALAPVAGSDPGVRHASHATAAVGMCRPSPPRLGSLPVQQSRAGRQRRAGRPGTQRRRGSGGRGAPDSVRRSSRWTGPPAFRGGEGTRPRREERTASVPGGRGDRRRSGGNADHAARRSLRELSREVGGGTSGDGPTGGTFGRPNRERWRSGVCPGDRRGRSTPSPARGYTEGKLASGH